MRMTFTRHVNQAKLCLVLCAATYVTDADARTLAIGQHSIGTNGTITVPVLGSDAARVAGVDITLRFNPSILTARYAATPPLSADYNMQYNATVPGEIRISLAKSTGLASGSGPLVNIVFDVSSAVRVGDAIPLTLAVANLFDERGESVPSDSSNGVFQVEDANMDGLPDVWEERIVDADPNDAIQSLSDVRPEDDFDGDGVCNRDEYVADTDPTDPQSFLAIAAIATNPQGIRVDWKGGTWATQRVESSSDIASAFTAWSCICTNSPPTSVTNSFLDNRQIQGQTFYRIKVNR